jgi:hypothetical protein
MTKLLWSVTESLLVALAACIWVASTAVASASGVVAMVATTLLPGISQIYWIWSIRTATGKVPEPVTMLCVTWLADLHLCRAHDKSRPRIELSVGMSKGKL